MVDCYAWETDRQPQAPVGKIARYAWGDDYHKVLKKRLIKMADRLREQFPGEQFRVAVDTAPILEREQALRAGLGWIGKNTLLIHPQFGSWFVLGEIVTTLQLTPTVEEPMTDHCGTCTRCIDACPTQCLTPYQMDATRCISYLTLEHRSEIDPELHPQMGDWLAGCDICQEVCPHPPRKVSLEKSDAPLKMLSDRQRDTPAQTYHQRYTPRPPAPGLNLLEVLNWTPESRQQAFMGSALKRMKLEMVKRNALIAAGNDLAQQKDLNLRQRIGEIALDESESEMVRNTAKDVLVRLSDVAEPGI